MRLSASLLVSSKDSIDLSNNTTIILVVMGEYELRTYILNIKKAS